jgi:sigma-B regulation protein RsbU (phosphoserine phosphatase)
MLRRQNGTVEKLSTGGIALGMFDQSVYEQSETRLEAGDLLVAYSDGITEAENRAGQPFDEDGLERAIHTYGSSPAPDLARTLFTIVEQHAGDMKMVDDLTIVVVKRTDAIPPPVPADG